MTEQRTPTGTDTETPTYSVSVVVPAYNEAAHLYGNLETIWNHLSEAPYSWEIIVVDDGSQDGTGAEARRFAHNHASVRVLEHASNFGLGQSLQTAFRASQASIIVPFDADLSYAPEHIDRLVATITTTGAKVVGASPYMDGGSVSGVPRMREWLSRAANRLLRILSISHVTTVTGMVRAYDRIFISNLSLKSVDNQINAEIIYKTDLLRGKIVEIPADLVWTRDEEDTKRRRSNFSVIKTSLDFMFSGFIFRPFLFYVLPGTVLLALALYALGWAGYHVIVALGDQSGSLDARISGAAADAFTLSPHSFVIGGIALIFAFQLISLGLLSAQNKRYFEDLYFQGSWLSRRFSAEMGQPLPDSVRPTTKPDGDPS